MKISKKALKAIKTQAKNRIAMEMNCSVYTVDRWIRDNEENGDLTKARPVQIISEETELPLEEILEEVPEKEQVK